MISMGLYNICKKLYSRKLPKILHQQLRMFIAYIILPHCTCEIIAANFVFFPNNFHNLLISLSTTTFTLGIYVATRKMAGLRFLNFSNHVESMERYNFINDFKNVLEQLGHVTTITEISHISQTFFKDALNIPSNKVFFTPRKNAFKEREQLIISVERFISAYEHENSSSIAAFLASSKILIRDEIEFTNFYQETPVTKNIVKFLEQINADILLPIYDKQSIIGYIIIEYNARPDKLFNTVERDEMVVFASYLSNIINLLHNRNLHTLLEQEKELKAELFSKHQEINHYKESIRSFLRTTKDRKIGLVFYKNKKFTFGNQSAQEFLGFDINTQEGHPLTKAMHQVAHQVFEYKTTQTRMAIDNDGNKLILAGIPNLDNNNVIILLYYPEIADLVKQQIDILKDPSKWDYLLYLDTTKAGQLINKLIPGSGEQLLNFKIDLLKASLSCKPILLEIPEEDLEATVDIIHHISMRSTLHTLLLESPEKHNKIAIKLFGMNPLFGMNSEPSLLQTLHETGTLFIQNIHYLSLETQNHLAEFVKYGFYHELKNDMLLTANVRIICSTNQNLEFLVQEGKFSQLLFNELKHTSLDMPSLVTLPEQELSHLADGFTEQAIKDQIMSTILALNANEKNKLLYQRPVSLHEFKVKVHQMLLNKSSKKQLTSSTEFDAAYYVSDPNLTEAARLGKRALKDPHTMTLLWHKFKSQNQIASFLGVNRSSVSRRLKDFNLG